MGRIHMLVPSSVLLISRVHHQNPTMDKWHHMVLTLDQDANLIFWYIISQFGTLPTWIDNWPKNINKLLMSTKFIGKLWNYQMVLHNMESHCFHISTTQSLSLLHATTAIPANMDVSNVLSPNPGMCCHCSRHVENRAPKATDEYSRLT